MTWARILIVGGLTSYRALFTWLTPWVLIPMFLLGPVFQIIFFAFVGRAAGVGDDAFFVIGNAVMYAAIPCLFAMGSTIGNERQQGTLPLLLASPAARIPLFLGRTLPVMINGFGVSAVSLGVGAWLLQVPLPASSWLPLGASLGVSAFSCTGLGLVTAALALRVRETAVLSSIVFGILLVFSGANVPLPEMPVWMSKAALYVPLTHGIQAARTLGAAETDAGMPIADIAMEAAVGAVYIVLGLCLLVWFERESRKHATLDAY